MNASFASRGPWIFAFARISFRWAGGMRRHMSHAVNAAPIPAGPMRAGFGMPRLFLRTARL